MPARVLNIAVKLSGFCNSINHHKQKYLTRASFQNKNCFSSYGVSVIKGKAVFRMSYLYNGNYVVIKERLYIEIELLIK